MQNQITVTDDTIDGIAVSVFTPDNAIKVLITPRQAVELASRLIDVAEDRFGDLLK